MTTLIRYMMCENENSLPPACDALFLWPGLHCLRTAPHRDAVELAAAGAQVVDLGLAAVHVLEALLLEAGLEGAGELLAGVPLIHLHRARMTVSVLLRLVTSVLEAPSPQAPLATTADDRHKLGTVSVRRWSMIRPAKIEVLVPQADVDEVKRVALGAGITCAQLAAHRRVCQCMQPLD